MNGISIIQYLNEERESLFNDSYDTSYSVKERVTFFLAHKAVSVISLPANLLEVGLGACGCAISACTLGAAKIAIFALTLGNIKLDTPTGFMYCVELVGHGGLGLGTNIGEILYDKANLCYQGYRLTRWVAGQLHLTDFFNAIFNQLAHMTNFIAGRVEKGVQKAIAVEPAASFATPYPLNLLDDLTDTHRIDLSDDNRSLDSIFKHYLLSIPNIPLNAAVCATSAVATVGLTGLVVCKIFLYATTNIDIPVPTYTYNVLNTSLKTGANVGIDAINDVADGFILTYKAMNAIGVIKAAATVLDVILYIPEAIFS